MEFEITDRVSKEFPMYSQTIEDGWVKGCVYNGDFGCVCCICRSFCIIKEVKWTKKS